MTDRTEPLNVFEVFQKRTFTAENGCTLPYLLYIPQEYDCGERYPVVLFLHGAGERGDDNRIQLVNGMQTLFNDVTSPVYDSIIIAPQCPTDHQWVNTPWEAGNYCIETVPESPELSCVCEILDDVAKNYNVDDDRVYVTGLSMGGFGTWDLLARHGARFAAGLPICGGGDPSYARLLARIPIRTFHSADDGAVPVDGTRQMYASIRGEGGEQIDYTEWDGMGHGVWDRVYADRGNVDWLFAQNREERRKAAERRKKIARIAAVGGVALSVAAVFLGVRGKRK